MTTTETVHSFGVSSTCTIPDHLIDWLAKRVGRRPNRKISPIFHDMAVIILTDGTLHRAVMFLARELERAESQGQLDELIDFRMADPR